MPFYKWDKPPELIEVKMTKVPEKEECWECVEYGYTDAMGDTPVFPHPIKENEVWTCSECGTRYHTCRLVDGSLCFEYADAE